MEKPNKLNNLNLFILQKNLYTLQTFGSEILCLSIDGDLITTLTTDMTRSPTTCHQKYFSLCPSLFVCPFTCLSIFIFFKWHPLMAFIVSYKFTCYSRSTSNPALVAQWASASSNSSNIHHIQMFLVPLTVFCSIFTIAGVDVGSVKSKG